MQNVPDDSMSSLETLPDYHQIRTCTESYFERLGDSPLGMGWPNVADAVRRYTVMLDVMSFRHRLPTQPVSLLDLGCGCGHLYEHLLSQPDRQIQYTGIDLSERFISQCQSKHPHADFRQLDVLQSPEQLEIFDYAVINGIFTSKCSMTFDQMWGFVQSLLKLVYSRTRYGLVFNAMSKQVDWEREDLFHLPLDVFADFCCRELSRHFMIRNDYGLYEFAAFVYHQPAT
jgi:SAM-dependent methyltransferase